MCTRYISATDREIESVWKIDRRNTESWPRQFFPRSRGPFIRRARDAVGYERELLVGQWALVPWFATTAKLLYATVNARSEELSGKASYKQPWARGQRCIIPAESGGASRIDLTGTNTKNMGVFRINAAQCSTYLVHIRYHSLHELRP